MGAIRARQVRARADAFSRRGTKEGAMTIGKMQIVGLVAGMVRAGSAAARGTGGGGSAGGGGAGAGSARQKGTGMGTPNASGG